MLQKQEAPDIQWSYRVHKVRRLDNPSILECADASESSNLVLDYVAVRQYNEWQLTGEARQRPASAPDDNGKIITTEGMQVGVVVRDIGHNVIEIMVTADEREWESLPMSSGRLSIVRLSTLRVAPLVGLRVTMQAA